MNLKERTYLGYLSVLRIYVGFYILSQGVQKLRQDFPKGDWMGRQIGDIAGADLYGWYKRFLLDYVAPHHELFGYLVMFGEIAVGAALLLGFWTRWSSLVALFMVINYYLGPGAVRRGLMMAHQEILMVALAIFVFANPGRTLGLDGVFFNWRKGKARS